jgi:hypothetical protein
VLINSSRSTLRCTRRLHPEDVNHAWQIERHLLLQVALLLLVEALVTNSEEEMGEGEDGGAQQLLWQGCLG